MPEDGDSWVYLPMSLSCGHIGCCIFLILTGRITPLEAAILRVKHVAARA